MSVETKLLVKRTLAIKGEKLTFQLGQANQLVTGFFCRKEAYCELCLSLHLE